MSRQRRTGRDRIKWLAWRRQWYARNRSKLLSDKRADRIQNHNRYLEKDRKWRMEHGKQHRESVRAYAKRNRPKLRARRASERDELKRGYIIRLLTEGPLGRRIPSSEVPDALIEAKRVQVMLRRLTRSNTKKGD